MEDSLDPKEMAEKLGINPEEIDFTLEQKELDHVSGGAGPYCAEIGIRNPRCTSTGAGSNCTEIGCLNPDCTKAGM